MLYKFKSRQLYVPRKPAIIVPSRRRLPDARRRIIPATMLVTVDATGTFSVGSQTGGTAANYTGLTTTASATAIAFCYCWQNLTVSTPPSTTTVIWDPAGANQAFSLVATGTVANGLNVHSLQAFIYGLASPASSGAKQIRFTSANSGQPYVVGISFAGTDLSAPFRNGVGAGTNSGGVLNPTITVTSPSGDIALACNSYDFETMSAFLPAGGTTIFNDNSGPDGGAYAHRAAGAGSTTMSATANSNDGWSYAAVSVQPPAASGGALDISAIGAFVLP